MRAEERNLGYVQIKLLKVGKQKLLNLAKCDFHRMDITLAHIGKDTPKKNCQYY